MSGGGFQFAHLQNFSRKGDKGGRSVSFVLAEARRDAAASMHVAAPRPPEIVWGCSVEELEREHDDRVSVARKTIAGGKTRSVGREQHTLMTIVVSHPYTVQEVETDPAKRQEVERWEALNINWARQELGDDLRSIVRHTDEQQWHLHIYGLPGDPEMRASRSHPGQVAKAAVLAAGPSEGEDEKDLRSRSDRAYKAGMKAWQDRYFESVGVSCGLTRLGPGRRRLSRSDWHQERNQAQALKLAQEKADALRAQAREFVSKTKGQGAELMAAARAAADQVSEDAASIRAAAARKADAAQAAIVAAQAAEDRALKAAETARTEQEVAKQAVTAARRLSGLGGALRGFWDGLRRSRLADRIRGELRSELMPTVETWRRTADTAQRQAAEADRRRRDVERTARELRRSADALGAQRDELRERLAAYEPAAPSIAPVVPRPQP